jgi:hypothetical protein
MIFLFDSKVFKAIEVGNIEILNWLSEKIFLMRVTY